MFHALARTAQAVAAAQRSQHAAAWETQAAAQAAERVLAYAGRMDAAVTAATTPPPAPPAPDDGLTDAERKVRDVMAGRRTKTIRKSWTPPPPAPAGRIEGRAGRNTTADAAASTAEGGEITRHFSWRGLSAAERPTGPGGFIGVVQVGVTLRIVS